MWRTGLLLGLMLVLAACSLDDFLIPPHPPAAGGEVTITGIVLENVPACAYDADCYFTVETDNTTWTVIYGEGRRAPTPERPLCIESGLAGTIAFGLVPGDRVRVFARVIEDHTAATCYSTDYTIQLISPAAEVGSEMTITGIVVDTLDDCVLDGICALLVDTLEGRYTVVYNPGEAECPNFAALDMTIGLHDTVEVFAMVTGNFELSTCPSMHYYITRSG